VVGGAGLAGSDCSTHVTGGEVEETASAAVAAAAFGTAVAATTSDVTSPRSRTVRAAVALTGLITVADAAMRRNVPDYFR
jgi:hypothetical protein